MNKLLKRDIILRGYNIIYIFLGSRIRSKIKNGYNIGGILILILIWILTDIWLSLYNIGALGLDWSIWIIVWVWIIVCILGIVFILLEYIIWLNVYNLNLRVREGLTLREGKNRGICIQV